MKKTLTAIIVASAFASLPSAAEDTVTEYDWLGIYGMKYMTDSDKPKPTGFLDDGQGFGFEAGWRFDADWAARISATYLDLDSTAAGGDGYGNMFGIDAMYFLPEDVAYVFGGAYFQSIDQSYRMVGAGVGKHWDLGDRFKLITEVAAYEDFGQDYNDFDIKIGLAYTFGGTSSSYTPVVVDSDNDGVSDTNDMCPSTPVGTTVDAKGCDADSDGVLNSADQCPNTAAGVEVDSKGCAIILDSDMDGVADDKDMCADTPMGDEVHANGCTVFTEKEVTQSLRILFGNNSADVEDPADPQIVEFAQFMQRFGNTQAVIEGHSSASGSAKYNKALSLRRANAVKALLVEKYGIEASRLSTVGYGEEQLLDTSNTLAAHKINRRIDVKVSEKVKVAVKETK
jgi:OOP family OmpA-OmpF porin